jgi:hypothetical protein
MNAAGALEAARAVGVCVTIDGDDLVHEAAPRPPDATLEDLRRLKPAIVSLLQGGRKEEIAQHRLARDHRGVPVDWTDGVASLPTAVPLEGFSPAQWCQLVADAERFLHDWGEEAARHVWTVVDDSGCIFAHHLVDTTPWVSCRFFAAER